jgi:hypothetical protein
LRHRKLVFGHSIGLWSQMVLIETWTFGCHVEPPAPASEKRQALWQPARGVSRRHGDITPGKVAGDNANT